MIDRTTKLRWRRRVRRRKRQVEDLGLQTEEQLERHFFRRMSRLLEVRRFVLSWLLLVCLLITGSVVQTLNLGQYYQKVVPVPGGSFSEGIVGSFTNANPLYASGPVDSSVARLVFSGLFTFDAQNKLVGDLAEKWTVDDKGLTYTVTLKKNLKWQDGQELTAEDVLFTYHTIQNPDAKSPLFASWQGIKVTTKGADTIIFTLPNELSSFPYALTNGIVPKHLLDQVPVTQLRSTRFNTVTPVGSGPFKWEHIEVSGDAPETRSEQVTLQANDQYYGDKPKLQRFVVRSFRDEKRMLQSFHDGELDAIVGLTAVPDNLQKDLDIHQYAITLTGEVMVFFKNSQAYLSDVRVRQALVKAVDVPKLISGLPLSPAIARGPLLKNMLGYDKKLVQLKTDLKGANKLLDDAGWKKDKDGIRKKDGKTLTLRLFSQSTSDYAYISGELQRIWRGLGVDVQVTLEDDNELQGVITRHDYDMLLYGISLGVDPDVFAYWHSSQADLHGATRLNLSEYKSSVADRALEAGRTRADPTLRVIKYKPFLEAWRNDAPALALYQPRFIYITHSQLYNFEPTVINSASDRYNNVVNWMIRQAKANK